MADTNTLEINQDGKAVFDHIYDAPDPRQYYLTLGRYNYLIPDASKSVFLRLYDAYRTMRSATRLNVVDVGCSYGINAALHKFGLSMSEVQARFAAKTAEQVSTDDLRDDDHRFFRALELQEDLVFTGVDVAENAVRYATETRILDGAVTQDLERNSLNDSAKLAIDGADFVISTGAVGYVGRATFERIAEAGPSRPWIAAFVLRQFSFRPIASMLAERGYTTELLEDAIFPQRRFVNLEERREAIGRLKGMGRPPTPLERDGWFAANFFLARPTAEAEAWPLEDLLPSQKLPSATIKH